MKLENEPAKAPDKKSPATKSKWTSELALTLLLIIKTSRVHWMDEKGNIIKKVYHNISALKFIRLVIKSDSNDSK